MTHELLLCPECRCPLTPPSGNSTGMTCARCNTWVEFDPRCTGSCLSCHKTAGKEQLTHCTEPEEVLIKIDNLTHGGMSSGVCSSQNAANPSPTDKLRGFFKKLFAVR